jgi:GT2 family glycosyltransferase
VNALKPELLPPAQDAGGGTGRLDPFRAPIQVAELELSAPVSLRPAAADPGATDARIPGYGRVLALVRLHGHPLGQIEADVADPARAAGTLAAAARLELAGEISAHLAADRLDRPDGPRHPSAGYPPRCLHERIAVLAQPPMISVVVATRERPRQLMRALDSLTRLPYPRYEVIVVDNDPATDETERLVCDLFGDDVAYVREPRRGLAVAHNRGLAAARGQIVAFTDDDVVVDGDWLAAIAEGFAVRADVGCVTGLIVPAELQTPAQVLLEAHGGFAKGYRQRYRSAREPGGDPLFPFTAGRLGSGANMAFSARLLGETGGFDPATGAGSTARGGDDLLAFFRTVARGYGIVYQPSAIVWHHHHRTAEALERQAYGYGVGLGAYLAAALAREPRMLPALLRRLPRGLAYVAGRLRADGHAEGTWPSSLSAAQRRGLLHGPFAYAKSRWQVRGAGGTERSR